MHFLQQALLAHLAPQAWIDPNSSVRLGFLVYAEQILQRLEALLADADVRIKHGLI